MIPGLMLGFLFKRGAGNSVFEKDVADLIEEGAVLLDVRTASEYATGHIAGSVNISPARLREEYLMLDHEKLYVVYGSDMMKSRRAVELLRSHGFRRVYNGGTMSSVERAGRRAVA